MSIRGSRSPDIAAIEDRILSQGERAARLRAEAAQEALERETRLWEAEMRTAAPNNSESRVLNRSHGSNFAAEAERVARRQGKLDDVESRRTDREPCGFCGTRSDKHREFGCKRWRPSW